MERFARIEEDLRRAPRRFLVTGAAGFIGSHLVERLLRLGQETIGFDSFVTGKRENLEEVLAGLAPEARGRFRFIEADLRDLRACQDACRGVDVVLHQAALGSVPRSLADPLSTHQANVDGFLHLFIAARDARVRRVVYASSSSVYGDHPELPKCEGRIGTPLSPYALTKRIDELYAANFASCFGLESIGLRYFNVFGRRQDPEGAYAAVLPRWISALLAGRPCVIYGDGETSRDFCYIENVIQANLLCALAPTGSPAVNQVYNIACGARTTLNELYAIVRELLSAHGQGVADRPAVFETFRPGDVRHSLADIGKAQALLGYAPQWSVREGLAETMEWYIERARRDALARSA